MAASYRLTLVMGLTSSLSGLLVYGLLGSSASASVTSQAYNMSLASYLVSGVAFSSIIMGAPALFSQHASPSELEEVLVTPMGFREFLLTSSMPSLLASLASGGFIFLASVELLGLSFSYDLPLLGMVILVGLVASLGLGFVGLGLRLVYKQSSILNWVLYSFAGLVGNMVVPVQILPGFAQVLSYATPQYYFFTGIRIALGGASTIGLLLPFFALYAGALVVLGVLTLNWGLSFVRRNGTHRWV